MASKSGENLTKGKDIMYDRQTAKLVGVLGENAPATLTTEQVQILSRNGAQVQEFLLGLVTLANALIAEAAKILTRVGELISLLGTGKFEATKKIFMEEAGVHQDWFFNFDTFLKKVEENVPAARLQAHKLEKDSRDGSIMEELGGKKITALWHFFCLLKAQARGQPGALLTNGWANIFYIQDKNGKVWAVHCCWSSFCSRWSVCAYSVEVANPWGAGRQVFSSELL